MFDSHLVDIFAVPPQNQHSPVAAYSTYSGQDARLAQYQDVLAKLSSENLYENFAPPTVHAGQDADWPSDDEEGGKAESRKTAKPDVGPLVSGFADIEGDD